MESSQRLESKAGLPVSRLLMIALGAGCLIVSGLGWGAGARAGQRFELKEIKGGPAASEGHQIPTVVGTTKGAESAPVVAGIPQPVSPTRRVLLAPELPRSWAGGLPPPRSPVRGPGSSMKGRLQLEASFPSELEVASGTDTESVNSGTHPAIHRRREKSIRIDGPLFDRQGRAVRTSIEFDSESPSLERAMRMHPAGKGLPQSVDSRAKGSRGERGRQAASPRAPRAPEDRVEPGGPSPADSLEEESSSSNEAKPHHRSRSGGDSDGCAGASHRVRSGETLWSIAADALRTADLRRIARYWPKIHRLNRDVIGSNPDRIFPGQLLQLPTECDD